MVELITALAPLFKQENIALVVLGLICAGLAWTHVVFRKEDREDRKTVNETMGAAIKGNTDALTELRIFLAEKL